MLEPEAPQYALLEIATPLQEGQATGWSSAGSEGGR